jgi:hypothetical protein
LQQLVLKRTDQVVPRYVVHLEPRTGSNHAALAAAAPKPVPLAVPVPAPVYYAPPSPVHALPPAPKVFALIEASKAGRLGDVRELLSKGADIEFKDQVRPGAWWGWVRGCVCGAGRAAPRS